VALGAVLGMGVALLDSTIVNVALPTIGRDWEPIWPVYGGSSAPLL
jgi:hypothetical protein